MSKNVSLEGECACRRRQKGRKCERRHTSHPQASILHWEAGLKPLYVSCMYVLLLLSEASISTMTFQVCWVEPITKPDQIGEVKTVVNERFSVCLHILPPTR